MSDTGKKHPMTPQDAARIASSYAKSHGGQVDKGSFPARAQHAAAKNQGMTKDTWK